MPTIDDALRLAARYANSHSQSTGQAWRGMVEEFEHGWAIWTAPPAGQPPVLGDGNKTVLDRDSGLISHWPSWPVHTLAEVYATERVKVRRPPIAHGPSPGKTYAAWNLVTILAADGRTWPQRSENGERTPEHHPLVAQWLSSQPPESVVRGAERHAHLFALSEVLHDLQPEALPTCTFQQQRRGCDTCLRAYVHFGLCEPGALVFCEPNDSPLVTRTAAVTDDRFDPARWAQIAAEMFDASGPTRIPPVAAARDAIERYPVVVSDRRGPGQRCWVRPFHLAVTAELQTYAQILAAYGEILGAELFPLGEEESGHVIAVDAHGRFFVIDEAGAWFIGSGIDTALGVLFEGHQPLRLRSDGSLDWEDPDGQG
ncbi:SUKH-3 domain-containing protein [Rhizocola hellebori]|nr:SUKH-3 domain-containing protein [Rhizocola hellebori]